MAFQLLGAFVLVSIAVPVVLPVFIPLALIYRHVQGRYVVASREIKRWEAITRSPVSVSRGVFSWVLKFGEDAQDTCPKRAGFLANIGKGSQVGTQRGREKREINRWEAITRSPVSGVGGVERGGQGDQLLAQGIRSSHLLSLL